MLKKIQIFLGVIFLIGIFSMPYFSYAEMQIEVQENEINVETIPENPQPYENVTINISSYATDLDKAIIIWQGDKGTLLSGIGKKSYSFTAGGPDTANIFNINITPVGTMSVINKTIAIYPSEIETLWESVNGYTPPFYKGKALPTSGGFIKVVAIPNTSNIKSGNGSLSYVWSNNNSANQDASGYNKNSYSFKNSMLNSINKIKVTASSVSGSYKAEKTIEIPTYKPSILFYEKSPTEGTLYNKNLDSSTVMTGDEMTIVAEPYFMILDNNTMSYSWKINNSPIETPSRKTELTIRPNSRGGYADISLIIENLSELFQTATSKLKLTI